MREEHRFRNSAIYKKYLEVLDSNPNLQVKRETSREIEGVNDLLENQFLVVSDDYVSWVNAEEEKRILQAPQSEPHEPAEAFLEARRQERVKTPGTQRLEQQLHKDQHPRQRGHSPEQRLESMQASRTRKLIKMLHQIKARVLNSVKSSS